MVRTFRVMEKFILPVALRYFGYRARIATPRETNGVASLLFERSRTASDRQATIACGHCRRAEPRFVPADCTSHVEVIIGAVKFFRLAVGRAP